ncbi:MAG: ParB N-terminal domain-containing protein [Aggregatilineales bacterium]
MSRRRNIIGEKNNRLGGADTGNSGADEGVTHADVNSHLADFLRGKEGERIKTKAVDIFKVAPDPAQPRRAIPSSVRGDWSPNAEEMPGFLEHWRAGTGIDLAPLLAENTDVTRPEELPAQVASFLKIVDLARSVLWDGLLNPISVVRVADGFLIETGERRWMAYHLLHMATKDEKWSKIPAQIVDESDPFRQAAENNQRADLNAIGRARQYAILMMALHPDKPFVDYEEVDSDRAYYAQASDLRTPYGQSDRLLTAMGVAERSILTHYRNLLNLDDAIWTQADDEDWSLRQLLNAFNNSDESVIPIDPPPPSTMKPIELEEPDVFKQNASFFARNFERVGEWSNKKKEDGLEKISQMRAFLDDLEGRLKG